MEYHEAADYLSSLQRRRPKLGIETTARMLSHFDNPQLDIDCVQISGSNGKGSTARLLESILRQTGLRVGLFISPGLNDFRDQVRVDGHTVLKRQIVKYVRELRPFVDQLSEEGDEPTHFEALTAIALRHFGEMDVDVAILEVGIGGQHDATSAVDPVASAVTSVSLEHTELLGETVEDIARDKAQVAPEDAPLVTGADGAALAAIREEADIVTVGSEPTNDPDVLSVEIGMHSDVENEVWIVGPNWSLETNLSLLGPHQAINAGIAATLARQLTSVDPETISKGLRAATWPGRFEIMSTEPIVVLDGAHNPGAAEALSKLLSRYDYNSLHLVFAAMSDKEYGRMLDELPAAETAYIGRPDTERAETTDALAATLSEHAKSVDVSLTIPEATERAIEAAGSDDFVLVTGSLHTVSEARKRWTSTAAPVVRSGKTNIPGPTFNTSAGMDTSIELSDEFDR
jgi:folylpolyglutamate synthase/dihydrofolate synthase